MRAWFPIRVLLAGVIAAGCQRSTPPPADTAGTPVPPPSAGDEAPPPDVAEGGDDEAMFACAADADCEVVEMACCDHCNGGWQLSVARTQKDAAIAKHKETGCEGTACTMMACEWSITPVCKEGVCARTEDRDGDPKTPPELVENKPQ